MKVYVLERSYDYSGTTLEGAYSSMTMVHAAIMEASPLFKTCSWYVYGCDVDGELKEVWSWHKVKKPTLEEMVENTEQ